MKSTNSPATATELTEYHVLDGGRQCAGGPRFVRGSAEPGEQFLEVIVARIRDLRERTPQRSGHSGMCGREFDTDDTSVHVKLAIARRPIREVGNHMLAKRRCSLEVS